MLDYLGLLPITPRCPLFPVLAIRRPAYRLPAAPPYRAQITSREKCVSLLTAWIFRYSLSALLDSDISQAVSKHPRLTFFFLGCLFFHLVTCRQFFFLSFNNKSCCGGKDSCDTLNIIGAGGCKYTPTQICRCFKWNFSVSLWRRVISIERRSKMALKANVFLERKRHFHQALVLSQSEPGFSCNADGKQAIIAR